MINPITNKLRFFYEEKSNVFYKHTRNSYCQIPQNF